MKRCGIYEELGVRPIINAGGSSTIVGGGRLDPRVLAAMEEANDTFATMEDLLKRTGEGLARLLGCEAAFVTSGAYAALALGTAGLITARDPQRIAKVPGATDRPNEVVMQASTPDRYARAIEAAGGKLIEVGTPKGATLAQLEAACGPRTAALLYPTHCEQEHGVVPLGEVAQLAKRKGVALFLDAASDIYPIERMRALAAGAELVTISGKYYGSGGSTGILCGKKAFVDAALMNNAEAFESARLPSFGRGFKIDRAEAVATYVALKLWIETDFEARFAEQDRRIDVLIRAVDGLPHVRAENSWPRKGAWHLFSATLDEAKLGKTAAGIEKAMAAGNPAIRIRSDGPRLWAAVHDLKEEEVAIVAEHLRRHLEK